MSDHRRFALQLQQAQRKYQENRDLNAYLADCVYTALQMAAGELAGRNSRLNHLSTAVTAAKWLIQGAVDDVAAHLRDPVGANQSHVDFLSSFSSHVRKYVNRDLGAVKDVLSHLGLWREDERH